MAKTFVRGLESLPVPSCAAVDSREARDAAKELLEGLAGGSFLITSRRDDWPRGIAVQLPLDVFSPDEARDCLLSRYWNETGSSEPELPDGRQLFYHARYIPQRHAGAMTVAKTFWMGFHPLSGSA